LLCSANAPSHTSLVVQRERTEPHIACCAAIPRREKHSCHHPTTVLSGSRSEWLLAVPYSENGPQGDAFHNHGRHQMECDGRTLEDSKRSLPPVLPTTAGSMEQVCVCARVLLWRWLGKRCHMSYHYSATPHFREIFWLPLIVCFPCVYARSLPGWRMCFLQFCRLLA